jgi:hypothetical protein
MSSALSLIILRSVRAILLYDDTRNVPLETRQDLQFHHIHITVVARFYEISSSAPSLSILSSDCYRFSGPVCGIGYTEFPKRRTGEVAMAAVNLYPNIYQLRGRHGLDDNISA